MIFDSVVHWLPTTIHWDTSDFLFFFSFILILFIHSLYMLNYCSKTAEFAFLYTKDPTSSFSLIQCCTLVVTFKSFMCRRCNNLASSLHLYSSHRLISILFEEIICIWCTHCDSRLWLVMVECYKILIRFITNRHLNLNEYKQRKISYWKNCQSFRTKWNKTNAK